MEDAYDVPRIAASLDFVNLMAFDLHAERDSAADHHAPLHQRPHDASIDIFYNVVSSEDGYSNPGTKRSHRAMSADTDPPPTRTTPPSTG